MRYRSAGIYALLFLALLFGTAGALEIVHPVEEIPHPRHFHHAHSETSYHAPPACDAGEDHSHFCNHCQQSVPVFFYAASSPLILERATVAVRTAGPYSSSGLRRSTRAPPLA